MCWKASGLLSMKKDKNLGKSVLYLLTGSILFAIGIAIMLSRVLPSVLGRMVPETIPGLAALGTGAGGIAVFFLLFIGGLFYGWLAKLTFTTLGGKGNYFEGLTTIAVPLKLLSIGFIISAIFSYVPIVGSVVAFIALAISGVLAYSMMLRAAKELFATDMITAFVGVTVLMTITILAFYGAFVFGLAGLSSFLPGSMMLPQGG
ncbi:MAG: hypothetical protein HY367_02835 [Candidatus Aenigmarchaeota archaeon]|nr:hypothetical protein [Candidatus Aenigmarchaeota archaeon]